MDANKMMIIGSAIVASLSATTAHAQGGSTIGGDVRAYLSGGAEQVIAKENAEIHLGNAKIQQSDIGRNFHISTNGHITNTVKAEKNAIVRVAQYKMSGSSVVGDFDGDLVGRAGAIKAEESALVDVGSVLIKNSKYAKDLTVETDGRVSGYINAQKGSIVKVAGLTSENVTSNGRASFELESTAESVTAEQGSQVELSSVDLTNVTFKNGAMLFTNSDVGVIRAKKGAKVAVGSVSIANQTFNRAFALTTDAKVSNGIRAGKGAVVEIGNFEMN